MAELAEHIPWDMADHVRDVFSSSPLGDGDDTCFGDDWIGSRFMRGPNSAVTSDSNSPSSLCPSDDDGDDYDDGEDRYLAIAASFLGPEDEGLLAMPKVESESSGSDGEEDGSEESARYCSEQPRPRGSVEHDSDDDSYREGAPELTYPLDTSITPPVLFLRPYFEVPIAVAAGRLHVGVTVLKKWMRYHKSTRWPHRKLKSMDGLIESMWELARLGLRPQAEVESATLALVRQRDAISRNPGMEIPRETKRLRQAVFKIQHKRRRRGR